mgnify:CR=1 FL=1
MPRWDFRCERCNTTVELVFPTVAHTANAKCATCGEILQRLPASGGFVIKGYSYQNGYSK